jgi:4-amino-4-deoxy-L-arabinose transferase-like glycosyltransferase
MAAHVFMRELYYTRISSPVFYQMKRLILLAIAVVAIHALTNSRYGFHRDELATIDDARHLAAGYVAYPPVTPLIARFALWIFGPSVNGLRLFAALSQATAIVLTGLMARELGGNYETQLMAALATAIAPVSLLGGHLFQYFTFDYLWWTLALYFLIRLLNSGDPRWWLAIGASVGLGAETRYTIGVLVISMTVGVVVASARRYLASGWLIGGIAIALVIFAPNGIWQIQHHFIYLDFLSAIHARDVRIGRTSGFLLNQLFLPASFLTISLWLAGLYWYLFTGAGKRFRALGWIFVSCLLLFWLAKGRDYYMAPAYPILFAAGAVWIESRSSLVRRVQWGALAAGGVAGICLLPVAQPNSLLWNNIQGRIGDYHEEIGWVDLVNTVSSVRDSLPASERSSLGIIAFNYGEAGAIDLYGPARGLPAAVGGMNSYWSRGYPDPPPETLIVLGLDTEGADEYFRSCVIAARVINSYGIGNEESTNHPDIFVCGGPRQPWPEFWQRIRRYQ